jgi:predicted DNA binding CopG/RHH family protein
MVRVQYDDVAGKRVSWSRTSRRRREEGMPFTVDKELALKRVKVTWRLKPTTIATIDEIASREGVEVQEVVQQALDYALADGGRKKQPRAREEGQTS